MPGGRTQPTGEPPLSGSPEQQAGDLAAFADAGCDELLLSYWAREPEALGDRLEAFLQTPRRSLGWETPAALIERGDYAPILAVLVKLADGDYQ